MLTLRSKLRAVSTSLLISAVTLPVSVIAFIVLYEDSNSFWCVVWLTVILPAIWLAAAILTIADAVRRRSWRQIVLVLALLAPTVFLALTAVSARFAFHQLFTFRPLDLHLPTNGFVLIERFAVCDVGQSCPSQSAVNRNRTFHLAKMPDGCCSVVVLNGQQNKNKVDSFRIVLNGKDVMLEGQKALVSLQADNEINVQLAGAPGAYVYVIIAYTGTQEAPSA